MLPPARERCRLRFASNCIVVRAGKGTRTVSRCFPPLLPTCMRHQPLQGDPQERGIFLNFDDRLGLGQATTQPLVLASELLNLFGLRILGRLAATLLRQRAQLALLPLASPCRQVRGVQPLTAQKFAHPADLRSFVGLSQNANLVVRGKVPSLRFGYDLNVAPILDSIFDFTNTCGSANHGRTHDSHLLSPSRPATQLSDGVGVSCMLAEGARR